MAKKGNYVYDWPRPMVTVDAAVFAFVDGKARLLLVQRKQEPFQGRWALPGGFVEIEEDLPEAAARELAEETGLNGCLSGAAPHLRQTRPGPARTDASRLSTSASPRRTGTRPKPPTMRPRSEWFDIDNLPPMAFDHDEIARCAIERLKQLPHGTLGLHNQPWPDDHATGCRTCPLPALAG